MPVICKVGIGKQSAYAWPKISLRSRRRPVFLGQRRNLDDARGEKREEAPPSRVPNARRPFKK